MTTPSTLVEATPVQIINALVAVQGDFRKAEAISDYCGSKLYAVAAVKRLAKELKKLEDKLIASATEEFQTLQREAGESRCKAYGATFAPYLGKVSYVYSLAVTEKEEEVKKLKAMERENKSAKQVVSASAGRTFTVTV